MSPQSCPSSGPNHARPSRRSPIGKGWLEAGASAAIPDDAALRLTQTFGRRHARGCTTRCWSPASRHGGDWMDLLDRLLEHDRWATTQLLELCRGLTDAQLDQPFDVGHRTLRATLDHQIPNLDFWTGLMTGQPVEERPGPSSL